MIYVDGFVAAVPAANKEAYRKHAAEAATVIKEFGATRMVECWEDDVPDGKLTDFRKAVKAEDGEAVIFSWIEYPSKQVRDQANERVMNDPRMKEMGDHMPFDARRMIFGGFAGLNEDGNGGGMGYADGALVAVADGDKETYRDFAARVAVLFKEFGASRVVDAWGDDVSDGKITDFNRAVKATKGEKVVYSWVEWPSKDARDAGWAKAMADPRMMEIAMPFDGKRMVHGGFTPILDV